MPLDPARSFPFQAKSAPGSLSSAPFWSSRRRVHQVLRRVGQVATRFGQETGNSGQLGRFLTEILTFPAWYSGDQASFAGFPTREINPHPANTALPPSSAAARTRL